MDVDVVEVIDILDEKGNLYLSFENNKDGLYRLALIYNTNYAMYEIDPSPKRLKKVLLLTALYNNIFISYGFHLEQKDPILLGFVNKVRENYRLFYELEISNDSKIGRDFQFYKLLVSNFRDIRNYQFKNFENIEEYQIENLSMYYEECEKGYVENDSDNEDIDEEDESYEYSKVRYLERTYPLHPKIIKILRNTMLTMNDSEELMKLTIYCEEFVKQAQKNVLFKNSADELDELRKIISCSKYQLRIIKANFDEIYKTYQNTMAFMKVQEPTIYNDIDTFISTVLANFLNSKNDEFFDELKKYFTNFNESNEVDCMYVVKNFEDLLKKYNLETELKCFNHLITKIDVIEFAQDLYFSYQTIIKTPKFIRTFHNKHNRGLDNNNDK